jgi:hypothetical protein
MHFNVLHFIIGSCKETQEYVRKNLSHCRRNLLLPTPVPCIIMTSDVEKSEEKIHGNMFRSPVCCWRWKKSQLMNLTPLVEKDKIFVFFMRYTMFFAVEWCMIISTFFLKREGVQTHKARLIVNPASHTVNTQPPSWCSVAWYFQFYLLCFLISSREKHMRSERGCMKRSTNGVAWFFHYWCWLNKL